MGKIRFPIPLQGKISDTLIRFARIFILIDFPMHIHRINMDLPILHFEVTQAEICEVYCISSKRFVYIIANSTWLVHKSVIG